MYIFFDDDIDSTPRSTSYHSSYVYKMCCSLVYVDRHTMRIVGHSVRPHAPQNQEKNRRKNKKGNKCPRQPSEAQLRQHDLAESGLSMNQAKEFSVKLALEIDTLDKVVKQENRKLAKEEGQLRSLKSSLNSLSSEKGAGFRQTFEAMAKQRLRVYQLRLDVVPLRTKMKNLKQQKYDYDKFQSSSSPPAKKVDDDGSSSIPAFTSNPSLRHPGCMDITSGVNINELENDIHLHNERIRKYPNGNSGREIILMPGGTDPGSCVMLNTVPISERTLLSLHNRFEVLSGLRDADEDDQPKTLDEIRFPKAHQITAAQIRHHSGLTDQARIRTKMLSENDRVKAAYDEISGSSLRRATTPQQIAHRQQVRRDARDQIRNFEFSKKARNMNRHKELRLRRTYDRIAAKERDAFRVQAASKSSQSPACHCHGLYVFQTHILYIL